MKLELLLHHVSQDQRGPAGQSTFYGWMHSPSSGGSGGDKRNKNKPKPNEPCKEDHKEKAPDQPPSKPASNFIFRKEAWGGIIICKNTQNVYVADEEAFDKIISLNKEDELREFLLTHLNSEKIDAEKLEKVLAFDEIV